jgi:hypothetical protein
MSSDYPFVIKLFHAYMELMIKAFAKINVKFSAELCCFLREHIFRSPVHLANHLLRESYLPRHDNRKNSGSSKSVSDGKA